MSEDLAGRAALVTGGTRGIGLAVARGLADAGANVAIGARSAEAVATVTEELEGRGSGKATGQACDVRDPASCRSLVEGAVRRFGRLDVLVNNAGLGILKPIQELTVEEFQVTIETNLCGVFYCTKAAWPHLAEDGGGWVVNIGSLAGRNAFARGSAYNASKFGLLGLTEASMLDLRYDNVRVSLIMPGSVDTEFGGNEVGEGTSWKLQPDDVAEAVLDLLRYPNRALPSKIEMRPSTPPRR